MNEKIRCGWAETTDNMRHYHDEVWGRPEFDDQKLFAKLILDMNQAGLSWQTILNKWASFEEAYEGFVIEKVAAFPPEKVAELMQNAGVIRNRRKIEAAIGNAQQVLAIQQEFGSFSAYLWNFVDGKPVENHWQTMAEVPSSSPLSDQICQDLKGRGFKFVGTTIIYAFLQAVGIVNDHLVNCFCHEAVKNSKQ